MDHPLSILGFVNDERIVQIFWEILWVLPKNETFYLVGGTVRNALYYDIHKIKLPQRDYDIAYIGNKISTIIPLLESIGFVLSSTFGKDQFIMKKPRTEWANNSDGYIFLDISIAKENFFLTMPKVDFTIGGLTIDLQKIFDSDWKNSLRWLPTTWNDIWEKRLISHNIGSRSLFRAIRFIYLGFLPPIQSDIEVMKQKIIEQTSEQ